MPEYVYNYETGKVEPKPQGWPRLWPGMRTDDRYYPRPSDLQPTDDEGETARYDLQAIVSASGEVPLLDEMREIITAALTDSGYAVLSLTGTVSGDIG